MHIGVPDKPFGSADNDKINLLCTYILPNVPNTCNVCRVYRMRRQDSSLVQENTITSLLCDFHWLPLRQRIIFKIATLMHQCLNGLAPSYLATDCIAISSMSGRRQLRSAASGQLYNPRTKTMTFGPRSFNVSGPTIWNNLPARLKDSSLSKTLSENYFIETFLFDR